jgi:hypothetical protein
VAGSSVLGNESLGSIKHGKSLDLMSSYCLLKEESSSVSQ